MSPAVLHLAPHPDDELIGAPATLMTLRDRGWRIVNLACGLGRAGQRERRRTELEEACRRAGFELWLPDRIPGGSEAPADALPHLLADALDELRPEVVVSPCPRDPHPTHRLVAAAVARALVEREGDLRWWMWSVWGALRRPNLATAFDAARLEEVLRALEAHRGELRRNDYRRLVRGRAEASACLAPELLFGFGAESAAAAGFAELLTELALQRGRWLLGRSRWLDPVAPLPPPTGREAAALANPATAGEDDAEVLAPGEVEVPLGE